MRALSPPKHLTFSLLCFRAKPTPRTTVTGEHQGSVFTSPHTRMHQTLARAACAILSHTDVPAGGVATRNAQHAILNFELGK